MIFNNDSDGIRVGNSENNLVSWDSSYKKFYYIIEGETRYLGYRPKEGWRCYSKATNSYIKETIMSFYKYAEKGIISKPTITPNGGSITTTDEISISCTTEGASIYYTTDGSTPSNTSTLYTSPFTLSESESTVIKAIAIKEGSENSAIVEATFTVTGIVTKNETPIISPSNGNITTTDEISISCATEGASIYYTTDGSTPSNTSTLYTSPFTLSESESTMVKAIAIKDGLENSEIATATFTVIGYSDYSYQLATSVIIGGHYIIVGERSNETFAIGSQYAQAREAVPVIVNEGVISNPIKSVYEFEIRGSEGKWSLYDARNEGYLCANGNPEGTAKNYKLTLQNTIDEYAQASISFNYNSGVATIKFKGGNQNNWLLLDSSSNIFSCYESQQNKVYLYQRIEDPTTAVEEVEAEVNAPVEYYNLQGVKVANPKNGIFIKKQGCRASKVIM